MSVINQEGVIIRRKEWSDELFSEEMKTLTQNYTAAKFKNLI